MATTPQKQETSAEQLPLEVAKLGITIAADVLQIGKIAVNLTAAAIQSIAKVATQKPPTSQSQEEDNNDENIIQNWILKKDDDTSTPDATNTNNVSGSTETEIADDLVGQDNDLTNLTSSNSEDFVNGVKNMDGDGTEADVALDTANQAVDQAPEFMTNTLEMGDEIASAATEATEAATETATEAVEAVVEGVEEAGSALAM